MTYIKSFGFLISFLAATSFATAETPLTIAGLPLEATSSELPKKFPNVKCETRVFNCWSYKLEGELDSYKAELEGKALQKPVYTKCNPEKGSEPKDASFHDIDYVDDSFLYGRISLTNNLNIVVLAKAIQEKLPNSKRRYLFEAGNPRFGNSCNAIIENSKFKAQFSTSSSIDFVSEADCVESKFESEWISRIYLSNPSIEASWKKHLQDFQTQVCDPLIQSLKKRNEAEAEAKAKSVI